MPDIGVYGLPGIRAPRTAGHRVVFLGGDYSFLPQGKTIDGTKASDPANTPDVDVLRAGTLMGKITASSQYGSSVIGTTLNAEAIGSVAIETSVASATELLRRVGATGTFKLSGPPSAAGVVATETVTYSAIVTATGVITCTALVNAYIAGSWIRPTDGSELVNTFIGDVMDSSGKKVTDIDGTRIVVEFPQIPGSGWVDFSQLLPSPTDTSLIAFLQSMLNGVGGGQFVFSNHY